MAIDQTRLEEADYLADKLGALMRESRAKSERAENRNFYLQVAQFVVTGIVASILAAYGTIIQQHQQQQTVEQQNQIRTQENLAKAQEAQLKQAQMQWQIQADGLRQHIQEEETKAAKAKVILEFMPALADVQDSAKAKIALQAIKKFIDLDFAENVTLIVGTPALKEGLTHMQDQIQAQVEPVSSAAAPVGNAQETGWVYLGSYDALNVGKPWQTQYFVVQGQEKEPDKLPAPEELAKGKVIHVMASVGASNLRSDMPGNGGRVDKGSVLRHVMGKDALTIDQVDPVANTKLYWAHVTVKKAQ